MSSSDVKSKRVVETGSLNLGPIRIRGIQVLVGNGAGRLTITDGDGGETVLDLDFAQDDTDSVTIPDYGIRCSSDDGAYISTLTNITSLTVFYS
jgi:hypothetical protein